MKHLGWALFFVGCASGLLLPRIASASCGSNFTASPAADGATMFGTWETYPGLNRHQALEQLQQAASHAGLLVLKAPNYSGAEATMMVAQPSPKFFEQLSAQTDHRVLVVGVIPSDSTAKSADVRDRVCGLLAKIKDAGPAVAAAPHGNASPALGPITDPSRTSIPVQAPKPNVLRPSAVFDVTAARTALEPGSSVIKGQACGEFVTPEGYNVVVFANKVLLYPATPYFAQLMGLIDHAKPGRDVVDASKLAIGTRMDAKTDHSGHFQFSKMKPGKYYLVTKVHANIQSTQNVYAGSVVDSAGGADVYRAETYSVPYADVFYKVVDISRDGDTVDVTLQPRVRVGLAAIRAFGFKRGPSRASGTVLGCHYGQYSPTLFENGDSIW